MRTFGDTEVDLITKVDEASDTVTYIGQATPGKADTDHAWRIKKVDTSSGTSILFAGGSGKFANRWDQRASLTYS